MRRYKPITCILLILSVFSFVLAAPLAVRERADVQEEDRVKNWLDQAQQKPSEEVPWSTQSQRQGSSLAPTYASGTHSNPPSSPEGETKSIQSWTSTENRPTLSSEAESVSWTPSKDVMLSPGETVTPPLQSEVITLSTPPGREAYLAKMASQQPQIEHPSSPGYVLPLPPGREAYLAKMASQKSHIGHPSSPGYVLPLPPGQEAYLAKMASQQSQIEHPSSPGHVLPLPPGREAYLAKMASQKSPIELSSSPSSLNLPLPPAREAYLAKMASQKSPIEPHRHRAL
ncbi:hypothetical protein BGY98DRAFT_1177024 [Russula aff. rugulosa BPL654]|nr:hypothetical protein BGY98DRAFT_1177024 [Russula aff. rugulosa BPL654]